MPGAGAEQGSAADALFQNRKERQVVMGFFSLFSKKPSKEEIEAVEKENKEKESRAIAAAQKQEHETLTWPTVMPVSPLISQEEEERVIADPLTKERKDEIGDLIFQPEIKPEDVQSYSNDELLFLKDTLEIYNGATVLKNFEVNRRVFYNELLERVRDAKVIYVLKDVTSGQPLLENGAALFYLDKEHAQKAAELYRKIEREVTVEEETGEGADPLEDGSLPESVFDRAYLLGIENIIIDNGWYKAGIRRSEISAPPVPEGGEEAGPSPAVNFALTNFGQELSWKHSYEGKQDNLNKKYEYLMKTLMAGRLFVGMHEKTVKAGGQEAQQKLVPLTVTRVVTVLKNKKQVSSLSMAVFSGRDAFERFRETQKNVPEVRDAQLKAVNILEVLKMMDAGNLKTFVINPAGIGLVISRDQFVINKRQ